MGKQRFRKGLAGGLAALMLLQAMPMAASARSFWDIFSPQEEQEETSQVEVYESRETSVQLQDGTAVIPSGADLDDVKEILCKTLISNLEDVDTSKLEWEYAYRETIFGELKWGSIAGGTEGSGIFATDYSALANNEDGNYQVRIKDSDDDDGVTLTKQSKYSSAIELNEGRTVALPYNDDATVDYGALREAIWDKVVADTTPNDLTVDDVDIEYYATAETGSVGSLGQAWVPLEGGKVNLLTYPAISEGTWDIRISYGENDTYYSTSAETEVTFTDERDTDLWEPNPPDEDGTYTVGIIYNEDQSINYDAMEEAIYNAVVKSTNQGLGFDDVTIEYDAGTISENYKPLNNSDWTTLKKFGKGTWEIRFSWDGTQDYQAGAFTVTVTVEERPTAPYTPKDPTGSVTITVDENLETNFDALRTGIFNAVVASSDILTAENVTITYYAEAVTGSVGDLGWNWVSLEGGTVNALKYPAISAGEQQIRIYWPGDQTYAPTTIEATVTVNDREQVQFNLNEGPYEVGMKFTADQGYDYEATAQAIYEAVVASTTPISLTADDVTVEYNATLTGATDQFKPLDGTDWTGLKKFGTGEWEIRISWPGNQQYRGNSVTVNVTTTDNRLESSVALKSGVSFTYNMDPSVMEQAIFDSVIDWENSTLPAKETLSLDNFTIEYYGEVTYLGSGIDVGSSDWSPIGGKDVSLGSVELASIPQMGAGENQQIRVSFHGNADYRPSDSTEGAVTVNKATVKVSVHSDNIYADEALPEGFITTDPADDFDQYVIYAGTTSNVTTALYLDLPERYTDSTVIKLLDPIVEKVYGKSFTDMLNDGVTVGELRELLSTQELLDLLDKLNIDTGTFGQILEAVNKMPGILDSVRISFGAPNRAGLYTVAVVTDNQNYETGFGMGFLLVKMRLSGVNLTWNQEIRNGKLTAEEAKTFNFGATLSYDGNTSISQESVSYLYSGFTSKWRVYSSTTTPPTEPGRYVMTVVTLGGNYQAAPITRSFQITK